MSSEPAIDGSDVLRAADLATAFLTPLTSRDWSRDVPGLDFTVASVVAHAAEGPLWYAVDLTGGPGDEGAFELRIRPDAEPRRLLASLRTAAALCAMTVDRSPVTGHRARLPPGRPGGSGWLRRYGV